MQFLLLCAAPLYLYANVFHGFVPILMEGDQTFFWTYAERMMHGERIYRDFFQFTPPGADLFYLGLFHVFGQRIWVENFGLILLGTALCWLCFQLARQLMDAWHSLLAAALFLVLVYGGRLDATHHWLSLLVALSAALLLMSKRSVARILLVGALLGVASFFTQTTGAAAVIAVVIAFAAEEIEERSRRRASARALQLIAACGLTWLVLSAPTLANVGWERLWYFQVTYPEHYVQFSHEFLFHDISGPISIVAQRLVLYVLLISIYPAVLCYGWIKRRQMNERERDRIILLALMGLFLLIVMITRADWNRLYAVALPSIVLLVWVVSRLGRARRALVACLWILVAGYAVKQTRTEQHHTYVIMDLPAGRAAVPQKSYEMISWVAEHTHPGDYFLQAQWLNLYPALCLHSPVFVDSLWQNEITRPEDVRRTLQEMEQRYVQYILWSPRLLGFNDNGPEHDHLGPFRIYMEKHYQRIQVFKNGDEIWERR
jgi:hypothetical protein